MKNVELIPLPLRRRNEPSRWTVRLAGVDLGVVEEVHIGGSRTTFFRALACLPGWPKLVDLELHPDRELQAQKLVEFHDDPGSFLRHMDYSTRKFFLGNKKIPGTS